MIIAGPAAMQRALREKGNASARRSRVSFTQILPYETASTPSSTTSTSTSLSSTPTMAPATAQTNSPLGLKHRSTRPPKNQWQGRAVAKQPRCCPGGCLWQAISLRSVHLTSLRERAYVRSYTHSNDRSARLHSFMTITGTDLTTHSIDAHLLQNLTNNE